jgi:hypothetical protein
VDPSYPYPNARIGAFGFDLVTRQVIDNFTRDVMSYCSPDWVSDYTYEGVLNFRGNSQASSSASVQSSLMVWGRMEGAKLVLEPAFLADTRPSLPVRPGRYSIQGLDATGAQLFSLSFDPDRVGDAATDVRQFGFAIPMTAALASRIVTLRLSGNGNEVRSAAPSREAARVTARTEPSGRVRLAWNDDAYPMLVVRDPDTREILTFARGGSASVPTRKRALDVSASNTVVSTRIRVAVAN